MERMTRLLLVVIAIVGRAMTAVSTSHAGESIDVASPTILHSQQAGDLEKLASRELWRYLARVSGKPGTIADDDAKIDRSVVVLLDVAGNNRLAAEIEAREKIAVDAATLGDEGFRWKATTCQGKPALLIAAANPAGMLFGAYGLLEKLGFGFYLGGDTFPATGSSLKVDAALDEVQKPAFAIRGALPWGNLPSGYWDLGDLKYLFDQLAKQRCNFVGFHQYDHEPFCAYEWRGKLVGGEPFFSSLTPYLENTPLHTKEFGFGVGDYFDRDPFTSQTVIKGRDREDRIRRAIRMFADSLDYAHARGIKICLGFELVGDPTDPETIARLESRIAAVLSNYPRLDYIWFFQSESCGSEGAALWRFPKSPRLEQLVRDGGKTFAYLLEPKREGKLFGVEDPSKLDGPKRVAEAVRFSHYVNLAYRITKKHRPELPVAINGWGGDYWGFFTDFFVGLDKTLPKDIIFSAQDNYYSFSAPEVAKVYGQLSPSRRRWPIPWWKYDDGRQLWNPQANTKSFVPLYRDALAKKCEGVMGVYWSTRLVEEPAAFQARFAWNPELTYEAFYDDFAARCFGAKHAEAMSRILRDLDALGLHWTGAGGRNSVGEFNWFAKDYFPGCTDNLPKPENMKRLAAIRAELASIRQQKVTEGRLEGIERIDWLANTIDWLVQFDKAALVLWSGGPVEKLLKEADKLRSEWWSGTAALAAVQKAREARELMNRCGFREAVQMFPRKMSLLDDFGDLATMQVKAFAAYRQLHRRVEAFLGSLPEDLTGQPVAPDEPPFIVGRQPYSVVEANCDVPVSAVVMCGAAITSCSLHYRPVGTSDWKSVPMKNTFRRTYAASIPGSDVKRDSAAIEWYVDARDEMDRAAYWPKGCPSVLWSATIAPSNRAEGDR